MTGRPSDAAIAQAFWEYRTAQDFRNKVASFETIESRARELDAGVGGDDESAKSGTLESLAAQLVAEFPMVAIVRAFNNAAPGMGAALVGSAERVVMEPLTPTSTSMIRVIHSTTPPAALVADVASNPIFQYARIVGTLTAEPFQFDNGPGSDNEWCVTNGVGNLTGCDMQKRDAELFAYAVNALLAAAPAQEVG